MTAIDKLLGQLEAALKIKPTDPAARLAAAAARAAAATAPTTFDWCVGCIRSEQCPVPEGRDDDTARFVREGWAQHNSPIARDGCTTAKATRRPAKVCKDGKQAASFFGAMVRIFLNDAPTQMQSEGSDDTPSEIRGATAATAKPEEHEE